MTTKVSIVYLSGYNEKPTTAAELYLCQLKVMLLTALNIIFNPTEKGRISVGIAAFFTELSHKRTAL